MYDKKYVQYMITITIIIILEPYWISKIYFQWIKKKTFKF